VLAAGTDERYGGCKQFEMFGEKTVLEITLDIIRPMCDQIVIAMPHEYPFEGSPGPDLNWLEETLVAGGETRWDSAKAAFDELDVDCEKVLVVFVVRCNTPRGMIQRLLTGLDVADVAFPALKSTNTVCDMHGAAITHVYHKHGQYEIQTPTAFRYDPLERVFVEAEDRTGFSFVYSAYWIGIRKMVIVPGDSYNIKITYPADREFFAYLLSKKDVE